jgi:hypothetical protein
LERAAAHDLDLALGVGHLAGSPLNVGLFGGRKLGDHFGTVCVMSISSPLRGLDCGA